MNAREYLNQRGLSPFGMWFDRLDAQAAAKVTVAIARIEAGLSSNVKPIGGGLSEYKIDTGPGYRLYFAYDGTRVVILLGGGTKQRQQDDIQRARLHWADYKQRRKEEPHNATHS